MTYRSGQFILQAHIFFPINYIPWHTGCACTNRFLHFTIIAAVKLTLNEKCIGDYRDKLSRIDKCHCHIHCQLNVSLFGWYHWFVAQNNFYKSFKKVCLFFSSFSLSGSSYKKNLIITMSMHDDDNDKNNYTKEIYKTFQALSKICILLNYSTRVATGKQ